MSGHTPGPWTPALQCSESGWIDIIAASADRLPVGYATPADCGTPYERRDGETKANARLIASAPELLGALQTYVAVIGNTGYAVSRESARELYDAAQKAIAKATGVQP